MLEQKFIEPSQTEYTASKVFVPKKDRTKQFCVDYRTLNALKNEDSYLIPRIDEWLESLGDTTLLLTLDANSHLFQVEIDGKERGKTVFTSHHEC